MTQQPYGVGDNGAPTTNSYPPTPGQQPYAPQPYAATPGYTYPNQGGYAPQPPAKKPAVLGIVGLLIVAVCAVAYFLTSMGLYKGMFDVLGTGWATSGAYSPDISNLSDSQLAALMGPILGIIIASVIGLVGLIISIVATAQNRGRPFGIIGIILGILAPASIILAAALAMTQYGVI